MNEVFSYLLIRRVEQENDQGQYHPQAVAVLDAEEARIKLGRADAGYCNEADLEKECPHEMLLATKKDWKRRKELREKPPPRGRIPQELTATQELREITTGTSDKKVTDPKVGHSLDFYFIHTRRTKNPPTINYFNQALTTDLHRPRRLCLFSFCLSSFSGRVLPLHRLSSSSS